MRRAVVIVIAALSSLAMVACTHTAAPAKASTNDLAEVVADVEAPAEVVAGVEAPGQVVAGAVSQRIDYGDDPAQFGWWRLPAGLVADDRLPLVVLVHGGFWSEPWDYTLMEPMAEALAERGVATWNIEFRRLGGRGGWPTTFDDVSAALEHVAELAAIYPIDLDRIVVAGHSSGGHLALWSAGPAGAHVDVIEPAAAVGIAAITDLEPFGRSPVLLGGSPSAVPDRWAFAAPSLDPSMVRLVHGDEDRIVPLASIDNARATDVEIVVVDGADHFDVIEPGPAFDRVIDELVSTIDGLSG